MITVGLAGFITDLTGDGEEGQFHWLSILSLVRYRSLCAMRQIYYSEHDTSLDPPIIFGRTCSHPIYAAQWWNDLPEGMITAASTYHLYDYILCNYDLCVSRECIFVLVLLACIMCVCMYVVL